MNEPDENVVPLYDFQPHSPYPAYAPPAAYAPKSQPSPPKPSGDDRYQKGLLTGALIGAGSMIALKLIMDMLEARRPRPATPPALPPANPPQGQ